MKKECRKILCFVLAVGILASSILIPNVKAEASTTVSAVHIPVKSSYNSFEVIFEEGDYQIANLSTSSGNLICRTTYTSSSSDRRSYSDNPWGSATISLYAQKKGKYTLSFDVIGYNKEVKKHHSLTVYANDDMAIKNITFAGTPDFYGVASKTKGKFKVTMTKGYKLNSIKMITYNKDGESVEKTIKNGKKVTLGKYRYRSKGSKSENYEWWYADLLAETIFRITYTDKYTKEPKTVSYYLYAVPSN